MRNDHGNTPSIERTCYSKICGLSSVIIVENSHATLLPRWGSKDLSMFTPTCRLYSTFWMKPTPLLSCVATVLSSHQKLVIIHLVGLSVGSRKSMVTT